MVTIDGKQYALGRAFNKKKDAMTHAKKLRSAGNNARVIKDNFNYAGSNFTAYKVYYRSNRKVPKRGRKRGY